MLGRLGLISSSNFYVPQVNRPGSMASFVSPAGILLAAPMSARSSGLGQEASTDLPALVPALVPVTGTEPISWQSNPWVLWGGIAMVGAGLFMDTPAKWALLAGGAWLASQGLSHMSL
jgi:hypothetical protein